MMLLSNNIIVSFSGQDKLCRWGNLSHEFVLKPGSFLTRKGFSLKIKAGCYTRNIEELLPHLPAPPPHPIKNDVKDLGSRYH